MSNSNLDDILDFDADDDEVVPIAGLGYSVTLRQKRLAEAWVKHGNGTRAAREAGYSGDSRTLAAQASAILRYPNVRAFIAELLSAVDWTPSRVKAHLAQEAVNAESDGARIKALELLGKTNPGMFSETLAVTRGDALSDDSLAEKLADLLGRPELAADLGKALRGEKVR